MEVDGMKYKYLRTVIKTLHIASMISFALGIAMIVLFRNYSVIFLGYVLLITGDQVDKARLHCVIEDLERELHSS